MDRCSRCAVWAKHDLQVCISRAYHPVLWQCSDMVTAEIDFGIDQWYWKADQEHCIFFISEEQRLGGVQSCRCKAQEARSAFPRQKKKKVNTSLSISGFSVGLDRHLPSFRIQLSIALVYEKGLVVAMSRLDTRSIRVCCHCSVYPYIEIRRDCFWERCSRCFENSSLFGLCALHSLWWLGLGLWVSGGGGPHRIWLLIRPLGFDPLSSQRLGTALRTSKLAWGCQSKHARDSESHLKRDHNTEPYARKPPCQTLSSPQALVRLLLLQRIGCRLEAYAVGQNQRPCVKPVLASLC